MPSEIGYARLAERLLDVLRADPALAAFASEFRLGELPERTDASAPTTVYVTTAQGPFATREGTGSAVPGAERSTLVRLEAGVVASRPLPDAAKLALLEGIDGIVRVLRDNPRLELPEGGDPLCQRSVVTAVEENPAGRGSLIQDAIVSVQCQVGPQWRLDFGDFKLDLLGRPLEATPANLERIRLDNGSLTYALIDKEGLLHVEYEDTFEAHDSVQALVDAAKPVNVTLSLGTQEREYKVVLREPRVTSQFDQISRAVLSMAVVR